jgi:cell division septation protein DedD
MRKPPSQLSDADSPAPKNGWLGLAVVGSLLIMAALGLLNFKLLRSAVSQGRSMAQNSASAASTASVSSSCENRFSTGPPQVTFYSELMAPENRGPVQTAPTLATTEDKGANNLMQENKGSQASETVANNEEANRKKSAGPQSKPRGPGHLNLVSRNLRPSVKNYTVQVGAFSHPGIAQQWAKRWKDRGYNVSLKPVARPSGVIYRLYLGNFASESQADELVRHLKSKEGISAFRLLVSN